MAETGNYQLKQWESEDRILMEDFNADNAKVDQALAAEKAARESALETMQTRYPLVYLMRGAATEGATQVSLDVSGINLSEYLELYIHVRYSQTCSAKYLGVRVNGLSTGYVDSSGGTSNSRLSSATPANGVAGPITIAVSDYLKGTYRAPITTAEVNSIQIVGMNSSYYTGPTIAADTQVWLYGLKRY